MRVDRGDSGERAEARAPAPGLRSVPVISWSEPGGIAPQGTLIVIPGPVSPLAAVRAAYAAAPHAELALRSRLGQDGCGTILMYGSVQLPKMSLAWPLETEPARRRSLLRTAGPDRYCPEISLEKIYAREGRC